MQTALGILTYNPRYASSVIKKLLESAIANAENNNGMNADNLYVCLLYTSMQYPEATLKELGMMLSPQVGKSGVNHRLRKLSAMADELREKQGGELL